MRSQFANNTIAIVCPKCWLSNRSGELQELFHQIHGSEAMSKSQTE